MDQLNRYRNIIRESIAHYAKWSTNKDTQGEIVFDPVKDHFEVICIGWEGVKRIHMVVVHVDIIDGKVWIQHDATDRPIAVMLVEAGIPKSDIVLGFQSPRRRAMGEYAVA